MRVRILLLAGAAAAAGAAATYFCAIRPWWRSWGTDPSTADRSLPGDDLVAAATVTETRAIEIGVPPRVVWPWLVQMGYGRGGWYSYDRIDMRGRSADRVQPDLQHLAVGDMVPNSPETAFEVKVLEPERALVLFGDEALLESQLELARQKRAAGQAIEAAPANLKAASKLIPPMPGFALSWAFVLEPLDEGRRTRLIERFRVRMPAPEGPLAAMLGETLGFGVFAMVRKQMLGIRDRAEAELIAAGISAEFAERAAPAETPVPPVPPGPPGPEASPAADPA
jgi:hypothetical protein